MCDIENIGDAMCPRPSVRLWTIQKMGNFSLPKAKLLSYQCE